MPETAATPKFRPSYMLMGGQLYSLLVIARTLLSVLKLAWRAEWELLHLAFGLGVLMAMFSLLVMPFLVAGLMMVRAERWTFTARLIFTTAVENVVLHLLWLSLFGYTGLKSFRDPNEIDGWRNGLAILMSTRGALELSAELLTSTLFCWPLLYYLHTRGWFDFRVHVNEAGY